MGIEAGFKVSLFDKYDYLGGKVGAWPVTFPDGSSITTADQEVATPTQTEGLYDLIAVMDIFLIATALYIFAVGLYALFIGKVDLPQWFECGSLHDLKVALSRVIILVMAVTFLEHLVDWKNASETLMFAAAIAIIMLSLIAYGRLTGQKD